MASPGTTPPPTPEEQEPDTNNVGTFTTSIPLGYVEPSAEQRRRIEAKLRDVNGVLTRQFFQDLLVLKLLMPDESQDIRIFSVPEVAQILGKVRALAVSRYHHQVI